MNTLFSPDKDTMLQPIGNNYSLKVFSKNKIALYHLGNFIKEVDFSDGFDRRLFLVDLIEKHGVKKSKISEVLGISRVSVDTWLEIYRSGGQSALINSTKKNVGRKRKNNIVRPTGNKFQEAEKNRAQRRQDERQAKQEIEKQQLNISFSEGFITKDTDDNHFNEEYDYKANRYAGSFIYWSVYQYQFKIMSLIGSYFKKYSTVIYLFLMMQVNRINSIEQLKTEYKKEFGALIGIKRLWSAPNIWQLVHGAVSLKQSKNARKSFFKYQVVKGIVSLWYLFIDGHFIPYTGKEKTHKNFHTQTGLMEAGQNEIFIHDIKGRVVYFDLQEGKGDMLGVIREQSRELSPYLGNIPPLFVVDKELWGVEKFLSLPECRFITWEKSTDKKAIEELPVNIFSNPFTVHDIVYQVYEMEKEYKDNKGNSIKLRRIVIWNHQSGKRSVAVTQDSYESAITLAYAMINRWGKSENTFKHMGERVNMHYNPVIEISRLSEKQHVDNPQYKELNKSLKATKTELAKTERNIGRKEIRYKKDGSVRENKNREKLQEKRIDLLKKIKILKQSLSDCPKRIDLQEIKDTKKFKVIETEGKNLWDLSETIFWNSRKKLISILKEYLPNERDLISVLEATTKTRGWVKSTKESLIVKLEPLERPQFRQAQIQLCRKLNEMNACFSNGKQILFEIADRLDKNVQF